MDTCDVSLQNCTDALMCPLKYSSRKQTVRTHRMCPLKYINNHEQKRIKIIYKDVKETAFKRRTFGTIEIDS